MRSNKLKLNADKTHFLLVGAQERLRHVTKPTVHMDRLVLKEDMDKYEFHASKSKMEQTYTESSS